MNFPFFTFLYFYTQRFHFILTVRPAYEHDEELCPFRNRFTINDIASEMTPRQLGMKYFRRMNDSRELMTADKARSICKLYNLEMAEILDYDDYKEAIAIMKDTGWSFWIAVRGKINLDFGNYHFDFRLADGYTRMPFHDLDPQKFTTELTEKFKTLEEGCITITPSTAHATRVCWQKTLCTDNHDVLCQYKKSCYKRSDYMKDPTRPIKWLNPLVVIQEEDSGYYVSTLQASWPFAKQVCEDLGLSLLWFDDDKELDAFVTRMGIYVLKKVQYLGQAFWTAGRFSAHNSTSNIYDKLYWWKYNTAFEVPKWDLNQARSGQPEHSGGFLKTWGRDREAVHLAKNEPYDEGLQKKEACVTVTFSEIAEFFTSKCDGSSRYFICKNPDIVKQTLSRSEASEPSSVEYCASDRYYQSSEKDCNGEVIFAGPSKPDCTCFNGVHALMADMKCKPKLLVGNGCVKLKAKSSLHWKILPSSIIHENRPWIVVAHSSDQNVEIFEWFAVNVEESAHRQVLGAVTFFFSGFDLYQSGSDVCFVMNTTLPSDKFYEYNVHKLPAVYMRYYNYPTANCQLPPVMHVDLSSHRVAIANSAECELSLECLNSSKPDAGGGEDGDLQIFLDLPKGDAGKNAQNTDAEACEEGNTTCSDNDIHQDGAANINKKGKSEGDIEDANDNVNRQLLIYAIEAAFPHYTGPADTLTGPTNSWIILGKIFELAKQACVKMVRPEFLSRVFKYFRIAHFGENYEYGEYFTEAETRQALTMLDSCHERAMNFKEMNVEVDKCTGKASKVTLESRTGEIITRSAYGAGYQAVFHHHVMEATWDVIDLWNALCLTEFKSSYLLFHHIERGLEVLFNDKLRKLWHFPNVTEGYFQKLLGPDEGIQLLNLDQCVLAAYKGNLRINRMGRPNRGMNTVVGQMIRNRLEDEKLKDRGIPASRQTGQMGNFSTACIRGHNMRCHRKPLKNKKNRPREAILALSKKY